MPKFEARTDLRPWWHRSREAFLHELILSTNLFSCTFKAADILRASSSYSPAQKISCKWGYSLYLSSLNFDIVYELLRFSNSLGSWAAWIDASWRQWDRAHIPLLETFIESHLTRCLSGSQLNWSCFWLWREGAHNVANDAHDGIVDTWEPWWRKLTRAANYGSMRLYNHSERKRIERLEDVVKGNHF